MTVVVSRDEKGKRRTTAHERLFRGSELKDLILKFRRQCQAPGEMGIRSWHAKRSACTSDPPILQRLSSIVPTDLKFGVCLPRDFAASATTIVALRSVIAGDF